jgi:pimeloyl-ACP methyl ester carboxylesterase
MRWLFSAIAVMLVAAAACAYGALCLLFYQGQWQMLYHPSRTITATPASAGLRYGDIHFDYTETGVPRLAGWWIPAAPDARYSADTILYLHDAKGSLSDYLPQLTAMHNLGINVFAFDYRGFGQSSGAHPTELLANADSDAAWSYLTDTRQLPIQSIAVYGSGTGATFAAALAAHHAAAALILEDPNPPAREIFHADARARILPLFLLQNETLDPRPVLASLSTPKLFLDRNPSQNRAETLFKTAATPKSYFDLRKSPSEVWTETLRRFLDEVLAAQADAAPRQNISDKAQYS